MKVKESIIVIVNLMIIISTVSYGQVIEIGKKKYKRFDESIYTIVDGRKGSLVDTNHVIVRLKNKELFESIDLSKIGLQNLTNVSGRYSDGYYKLRLPSKSNKVNILNILDNSGYFDEVFFNIFYESHSNDVLFNSQWNLSKVDILNAWNITTGSSSVIVAVIDDGFDYYHEDLAGNNWPGIGHDFFDNDSDPYPYDGSKHGTAVAGIVAALSNNSIGVAGVAGGWDGTGGVRLMYLRAGDANGYDNAAIAQSIDFAVQNGAKIINMSLGSPEPMPDVESSINNAVNNDVICIASSGNHAYNRPTGMHYPAAYSNVLSVGATIQNDTRKAPQYSGDWGSRYGSQLDVVAPGVTIPTTDITGAAGYSTGDYNTNFYGTSAAAPMVSGLAGLILSVDNTLSEETVRSIITYSADDINSQGFDTETGWGRVNAFSTIRNVDRQFTLDGELQNDEFWWGSITLNGNNVVVPSGVKLTIDSEAIVHLNGRSIISTGGTISVNKESLNGLRAKLGFDGANGYCGSIQTAIDNSDLNNNIYIQPGIHNENISIVDKSSVIYVYGDYPYNTIVNGNIFIYNSNYPQLYTLGTRFINIYSCTNATISEVIITPWSEDSDPSLLSNNNSNLHMLDLTLSNATGGLGAYFSSTSGQIAKNNGTYLENNELAAYFISNSSIYSYNTYFCGNDHDITTDASSYVYTYNFKEFYLEMRKKYKGG
ncbi:MAG: S8 family serine peptidase [Ignavibacteria bacterium]|jgi:hypothetical protein